MRKDVPRALKCRAFVVKMNAALGALPNIASNHDNTYGSEERDDRMSDFRQLFQSSKMVLIASLPANRWELVQAAVEGGADAVKMHINVAHRASGTQFGTLDENMDVLTRTVHGTSVPVGIVPGDAVEKVRKEDIVRLAQIGVGFVSLYAHHTPAWLLEERRLAKMIAVDGSYSNDRVSDLLHLDFDVLEASCVHPDQYGKPLNTSDLAAYAGLSRLSSKPVVVPTQKRILPEDLGALKKTGVKGLMVGAVVAGTSPDTFHEAIVQFRKTIDAMV